MATGYGAWVFTDDYRAIVDASVSSTTNTACTVYVDGKMQSQYAGGSYWSGNATSDANGGTSSSGTFACSAGQTKTFKSNSFTVSRGTSAKTITCKATVFGGGGTYANTSSTASVNVTIPAKPSYSVTYNANGGSGAPGGQTKWYGDDLTLSSTKPTRTGYTFKGWATSSSSSTVAYAAGAKYTGNAALSLYAVWQAITYSIGYNANGGTGAPASQTKTYGTALTLSSTKPTRAASVDATFTVTYNANGGSVSPSSATSKKRTNFTFKNWNTASNGSGTAYNPGASYSANAAATLYAQWNSSPSTDPLTLPRPTRTNYSFNGWYTAATGGSRIGAAGASYTPTASIQIFAQWTLDYAAPTLGTFMAVRCNADGTANDNGAYVNCTLKWANGNKAPQSVKFAVTGTSYSATVSTSATATTASAVLGGSLSTDSRYTVTATLTDAMPRSYSAQTILTPAFFTLDFLKGGRGVAIGQAATLANVLDVAMEERLEGQRLRLYNTNLNDGTAVSADTVGNAQIYFHDLDGDGLGWVDQTFWSNGRQGIRLYERRIVGGSVVYNGLIIAIGSDGSTYAELTSPLNLRGIITPSRAVNWITGANGDAAVFARKANGSVWYPAVCLETSGGGSWQMGNYNDERLVFAYATKANRDSNTNSVNQIYLPSGVNGTIMTSAGGSFTGSVVHEGAPAQLDSNNLTNNTKPASDSNGSAPLQFRVSGDSLAGNIVPRFLTNGNQFMEISGVRNVNGTYYFNGLQLGVNASGGMVTQFNSRGSRNAFNLGLREVLYYNATGTNGNVTLSASAANFNHLTIYYRTNDNFHSSVDVFAPNGKIVSLQSIGVNNAGNNMYLKSRTVTINGTSITKNGEGSAVLWTASTGYPGASTDIYITRVEGW